MIGKNTTTGPFPNAHHGIDLNYVSIRHAGNSPAKTRADVDRIAQAGVARAQRARQQHAFFALVYILSLARKTSVMRLPERRQLRIFV
jgi:hypothetical protein